MPPEARVTSIEALGDFRARLIVFIEKTSVAVDDALDDVSRTRQWLQSERPPFGQPSCATGPGI